MSAAFGDDTAEVKRAMFRGQVRDALSELWGAADLPFVRVLRELVDERDRSKSLDEELLDLATSLPPLDEEQSAFEGSDGLGAVDHHRCELAHSGRLTVSCHFSKARDVFACDLQFRFEPCVDRFVAFAHVLSSVRRIARRLVLAPEAGSPAKNAPASGDLPNPMKGKKA